MKFRELIMSLICFFVMALINMGCQNTLAQTPTRNTKGVLVLTPQQKSMDDNFRRLIHPFNRLTEKTHKLRSITDEEIAKIKNAEFKDYSGVELRGSQAWGVRENALLPFTWLTPKTLKPGQEAAIMEILKPILTANDTREDPMGFLKFNAILAVKASLRDKSLLPIIQSLKKDKRDIVSREAGLTEQRLLGKESGHDTLEINKREKRK